MGANRNPEQECAPPKSPGKWMMFVEFPVATMLAAFYEISEMWDDLYFGGHRIKGIVDTPRDLQFNLIGSVRGAVLTYAVIKGIELGWLRGASEQRAASDEIRGLFQMQRSKP